MKATHPGAATLLRSVQGDLGERDRAAVARHVSRCRACKADRDAARRIHEKLAAARDALAFPPGDPFAERPKAPITARMSRDAADDMAEALRRLKNEKERIGAEITRGGEKAGIDLELSDPAQRLAAAHLLEEAASADPSPEIASFARALGNRLEVGAHPEESEAGGAVPSLLLRALAALAGAARALFEGNPAAASPVLAAAWRALGSFDAPEHLVAWAETLESLRRSYQRRPVEGRVLAERALETFEKYGLARSVVRARHARAVALYYGGGYREAHREFRTVLTSKSATTLDRARALNGLAFSLAARGRFTDAAKEYAKARRRLSGDRAVVEQHFLQGEMKVVLGTAGCWHLRRAGPTAFGLPEARGVFAARRAAEEIADVVDRDGIDELESLISGVGSARHYVCLYVTQLAMPRVSRNPAMYLALAKALGSIANSLSSEISSSVDVPLYSEQLRGEAHLLESGSSNMLGRCDDAVDAARRARLVFAEANDDGFAGALADYFEGSAEGFKGNWATARVLLKEALRGFRAYHQEGWISRALAAQGTLRFNEGRSATAMPLIDAALERLHPEMDGPVRGIVLANKGSALFMLGRIDEARTAYAKALVLARRLHLRSTLLSVRYGLAQIELKKGEILRALNSFIGIADDARAEGFDQRVLSAELRRAECLGRLGRQEEMVSRVRTLRSEFSGISVQGDPPIRELFAMVDKAQFSSALVAHVVDFLEARGRGAKPSYRPFKLLKGRA